MKCFSGTGIVTLAAILAMMISSSEALRRKELQRKFFKALRAAVQSDGDDIEIRGSKSSGKNPMSRKRRGVKNPWIRLEVDLERKHENCTLKNKANHSLCEVEDEEEITLRCVEGNANPDGITWHIVDRCGKATKISFRGRETGKFNKIRVTGKFVHTHDKRLRCEHGGQKKDFRIRVTVKEDEQCDSIEHCGKGGLCQKKMQIWPGQEIKQHRKCHCGCDDQYAKCYRIGDGKKCQIEKSNTCSK